jgi:GNAT superfamily N-acetyltransferase
MNPKEILKICIAYQNLTQLYSFAIDENISFDIKMATDLSREEFLKLDRLTLHSKSMMSSFIESAYFGRLDVPAIIATASKDGNYIAWGAMQFTKIKNNYVKSIDVFVDPNLRRGGIGSRLVEMLKERGSAINNINGVPVEEIPRVGAWDETSRKFFKKHELKGDIEDPVPEASTKIQPITELDKMFAELDKEILQTASMNLKRKLLKFNM